MIDKQALRAFIEKELEGTDYFLVDLVMKPGNAIEVEIDSDGPVDIEKCERLTRAIEAEFDRDNEDYELTVGSSGLTSPLKNLRQYKKYVGREVEVLPKSGKKLTGILKEAGDDSFTIVSKEKVKKPESKKPVMEDVSRTFGYDEIKHTKYLLKF